MNNKSKLKISIVLLFTISMFLGCTDDFDKLNTPKNLVTDDLVDVNLILTRVQAYAFIRDNIYNRCGLYSGIAMNAFGGPFNIDAENTIWSATYTNYARNLSRIIELTKDDPLLVNKNAIARIMKVWAFAQCTDIYGDIPYSESALPLDQINHTPKYDTQESIYEDFFKELKEAVSQLDASQESYGSADILYSGDVGKWKKFGNSLRLRLAMRIRYVDSDLAKAQISDLNDADLITHSEDNAFVMTATDYNDNRNYNYTLLEDGGTSFNKALVSKTLVDIWQENNDPRLKLYADTAMATFQSFGYRGRPLTGDSPQEQKNPYGYESVSRVSLHAYAAVWPIQVLTAAEVNFALAEAALFGVKGNESEAQTYYQNGLESAMNWSLLWYQTTSPQLTNLFAIYKPEMDAEAVSQYDDFHAITENDISDFLAGGAATLTGTQEEKLEMIMNQKIVAFYPTMIYEGWAEWRRTGYPRVLVGDDAGDLQGVAPRRYMYPKTEQTLNADSYNEVLQRIGNDHMLTKVWWDANSNAPHEHPGEVEWMDKTWIEIYQ